MLVQGSTNCGPRPTCSPQSVNLQPANMCLFKWNAARERKRYGALEHVNLARYTKLHFKLTFSKKITIILLILFLRLRYYLKTIYYLHCLSLNMWKKTDSGSSSFSLKFRFCFSFQTTIYWSLYKSLCIL